MKIYAPVKDFNGLRNNVRFVNGIGETDNQSLLKWFESHGYKVAIEKCEIAIEKPVEKCDEPNFDSMTVEELRNWAKANGKGAIIRNTRNKDKLLEILRG